MRSPASESAPHCSTIASGWNTSTAFATIYAFTHLSKENGLENEEIVRIVHSRIQREVHRVSLSLAKTNVLLLTQWHYKIRACCRFLGKRPRTCGTILWARDSSCRRPLPRRLRDGSRDRCTRRVRTFCKREWCHTQQTWAALKSLEPRRSRRKSRRLPTSWRCACLPTNWSQCRIGFR